jgi:hypothetical protein
VRRRASHLWLLEASEVSEVSEVNRVATNLSRVPMLLKLQRVFFLNPGPLLFNDLDVACLSMA